MQYYNWNWQCPFAACSSFGYLAPYRQQYYYPEPQHDNSRTQSDVERVLPIIYQESANEINQAVELGMKPELVRYLIREMVEYIDRNYAKYQLSATYNITQASDDIKSQLYWILNIFRIYNVPFETQMDLLNNTVITTIRNLQASFETV